MKLKAVFVVCIAFLMLLSFVGVFSSTTRATTYSYYMDISNGNYRILDSGGNPTGYFSSSSGNVFNQLAGYGNTAKSGQSICIKSGEYVVDYTWTETVPNLYVFFEPNAILTLAATPWDTLGQAVFRLMGDNSIVDGAHINGNGRNQYPAWNQYIGNVNLYGGLDVGGENCVVKNCDVYNCRRDGIGGIYNSPNAFSVINCKVHEIGANGIDCARTDYSYPKRRACLIQGNELYNIGDDAITAGGLNTVVSNNYIHDCNLGWTNNGFSGMYGCVNSFWGIGMEFGAGSGNGNYFQITHNTITDVSGSAIIVANWGLSQDYYWISDNEVSHCATEPYGWWAAIDLWYSSYSVVVNNKVSNSPIGIGVSQPHEKDSYYATVSNNIYSNCATNFVDHGYFTNTGEPNPTSIPTPTSNPTPNPDGGPGPNPTSTPHPTSTPTATPTPPNGTEPNWSKDPVFLGGFGIIGTVTSLPLVGLVAPVGRVLKNRSLHRKFRHKRMSRRHRRYRRH